MKVCHTEVCLESYYFPGLFCFNKGTEEALWRSASEQLMAYISSSSFLRCIYYILNNKNIFWTDSVLWFSNANKMVNGKNSFPEESCTPLLAKSYFQTLSLRLLSPAFPQVYWRKSFYRKGIMETSAGAMEMGLACCILHPQVFHSSKPAVSFES